MPQSVTQDVPFRYLDPLHDRQFVELPEQVAQVLSQDEHVEDAVTYLPVEHAVQVVALPEQVAQLVSQAICES